MATNRRRYIISVNERMLKEIEKFKEEHCYATYSGAIQELVRLGLEEVKEEERRKQDGR